VNLNAKPNLPGLVLGAAGLQKGWHEVRAARIRKETTLSIKWSAARLQLGTSKSVAVLLHHRAHDHEKRAANKAPCAQLQFQPPV
jgi:hypothetical protein